MQPIKVLIDDNKWQTAKSETFVILADIYGVGIVKFYDKRNEFFMKYPIFIRIIFILCFLFLIFATFAFIISYDEIKNIFGIPTIFLAILTALFSVIALCQTIFYKKIYSTKTSDNYAKNLTKKIFKMPQNETIPFIRLYELTDDKIICYRYDNDNKVLHWQKTLNELRGFQYYIKDDFCVLYKKSFIRKFMFLWVDSGNKEILETYLKQMGLTKLLLPNK